METSSKFSSTELVFVISNAIISKLFIVYPSSFSALGASASILLALFTVIMGFLFTITAIYLYNNKKIDITNLIGNKNIKTIFVILITILFIGNQAHFVRSVAESLKISILPQSPLFFITLIYMLGVLICSLTGLKAIVRAHSFIVPFSVSSVIVFEADSVFAFPATSVYLFAATLTFCSPSAT